MDDSGKAKIDFTSLLLALSPVSIMTLEETLRRFRAVIQQQNRRPSSDAVRIESDPSVQMSSNMTTANGKLDVELDPNYITPNVEVPTITTLLNDVTKIQSRKRAKPAPTLATGRRNLKNEKVSEEEAKKRCKRRDSNRMSAQRSREKRNQISQKLEMEVIRLKKANELLQESVSIQGDTIRLVKDQLNHSCGAPTLTFIEPVQAQSHQPPMAMLSQPMSASSCGSECPVSNTSQGLTPPPLTEDIMIKHSPTDNYEQSTMNMRPTSLSIPTLTSAPISSDQSYLEQLHLAEPQVQQHTSTPFFQGNFSDNLSTPVMTYSYNNIEYGHADMNHVIPQMADSDPMNLP